MNDYTKLQEALRAEHVSEADQQLVHDFLNSFSYTKQQQLLGIFLGFPEKVGLFAELIKKKKEFTVAPSEVLAREIIDLEEGEMKKLIEELNN